MLERTSPGRDIPPVRVEEIVGSRIRSQREELKLSQEMVGKLVGRKLGREWTRQAVSAAEKGKRAFTAAELVAFAQVLGTSLGKLLTPPEGVAEVEIADGESIDRDAFVAGLVPVVIAGGADDDLRDTLRALVEHVRQLQVFTGLVGADIDAVSAAAFGVIDKQLTAEVTPVVAAVVTSSKGVLVGRRNDGKPPWTFIAGEVEPGERPEDAAVREVKEEAGCLVQAGRIIGQRVHPQTGRTMIYMAASPTHGTDVFVGDEAELAEVRWVSLAEADKLLPGMFGPVRDYLARELGTGDRKP